MRSVFAIACEQVIRDAQTNNVTLVNVLESAEVEGFPLVFTRVAFCCIWEREDSESVKAAATFSLELNGKKLQTLQVVIDFQSGLRTRSIFQMGGILLQEPGILKFMVTMENGARAEYDVRFNARVHSATDSGPEQRVLVG